MKRDGVFAAARSGLLRSVAVVASDPAALVEVAQSLAREGIGVSQGRIVEIADVSGVLNAFQAVQADPATEIVVLAAEGPASAARERLLERVRQGDKPTVVCFPGGDPRRAWQAGAIPATRLDEAGLRAVAWVCDWDQALISSLLEEERDELAARARDLQSRAGPGRHQIRGLFASDALRNEARLLLAGILGDGAPANGLLALSEDADFGTHLRVAWSDPACGVMLLSLMPGAETGPGPVGEVATALQNLAGTGPVPIAHVCGDPFAPTDLAEAEASLEEAGAVVVSSNASAALLAGLLIQCGTKGG